MSTPSKWVNTEPDAGAPHALLERLALRVPPASIDELWIFPTRRIAIGESTVFVVAARTDEEERSRVITARYAVTRNNKGVANVQEKIDEHGTAPAGAVARIVQGVLRRMGEEGEQPPRAERLEGDDERWWTLVEELGGRRPEPEPGSDATAEDATGAEAEAEGAADAVAADSVTTDSADSTAADSAAAEVGAELAGTGDTTEPSGESPAGQPAEGVLSAEPGDGPVLERDESRSGG